MKLTSVHIDAVMLRVMRCHVSFHLHTSCQWRLQEEAEEAVNRAAHAVLYQGGITKALLAISRLRPSLGLLAETAQHDITKLLPAAAQLAGDRCMPDITGTDRALQGSF